jgi:hypothetical protein
MLTYGLPVVSAPNIKARIHFDLSVSRTRSLGYIYYMFEGKFTFHYSKVYHWHGRKAKLAKDKR